MTGDAPWEIRNENAEIRNGTWVARGDVFVRIAICDDVPEDRQRLMDVLSRYLDMHRLLADIDCFESGEAFLSAFAPGKYQIVFMDIYMDKKGLTGMETAEQIRLADRDAAVILTTTSKSHGIEGYKLAVYYIVKPVEDAEFSHAMEKCREQIESFARTIDVISGRVTEQVRMRDILCAESQGRACVIRLHAGEIRANLSLDALCNMLGGFPFLRCHRSFVVNLVHTRDMRDNEFVLHNGQTVPISKSLKPATAKAFREYVRKRVLGKMV